MNPDAAQAQAGEHECYWKEQYEGERHWKEHFQALVGEQREALEVTRRLYTKLAQTHPGDLAEREGWLDEWNELRSALASLQRAALQTNQEEQR